MMTVPFSLPNAKFSALVFKAQLLEDVWGSEGKATLIPNLLSGREWSNSHFDCFNPNILRSGGRWDRALLGVIRNPENTPFRSKPKNVVS